MTAVNSLKTLLVLVVLLGETYASVEPNPIGPCKENCSEHKVHIAAGQPNGTYYAVGKALTQALREDPDFLVEDANSIGFVITQGSVDNLARVTDSNDPNYWLGIVQSDVLDFHYGRKEYAEFKVVGALYSEPVYVLVRRKLRLSSIEDLRLKKVAVGLTKSGTQHTSKTILGIFGISLDEVSFDDAKLRKTESYDEIANLLAQEEIDAAFLVSAWIPKRIYECIATDNEAYIHEIGRNDLVKIASTDPRLYRLLEVDDPSDKDEFLTIAVTSVLIAEPNMPEGIVRKLAEQLCKDKDERSFRDHLEGSQRPLTGPTELNWVKYPYMLYGATNSRLFHDEAFGYYEDNASLSERICFLGLPPGVSAAFLVVLTIAVAVIVIYGKWLWKHLCGWITGTERHDVRILLTLLCAAIVLGIVCVGLYLSFSDMRGRSIWFPLVLLVVCIAPVILPAVLTGKWSKWKGWLGRNTWVIWLWCYLFCICVAYFFLVTFESDVGNPDIMGSPRDLTNILRDVFRLDEVLCVTNNGKVAKAGMYIVSMFFGITMLGKMLVHYVDEKIREAFKMVPTNSSGHVVICGGTAKKIEGVVRVLRSGSIEKRRLVIVTLAEEQSLDGLSDEYDDVHVVPKNPASKEVLKSKKVNISDASRILILADDKRSLEPDGISLLTLLSVKRVLMEDRNKVKPDIIVELWKPDEDIEKHMTEQGGAKNVISCLDIEHKLLAQGVVTPEAVDFVREILTVEKTSNEVYVLEIPGINRFLEGIEGDGIKDEGGRAFSKFTERVLKWYAQKQENMLNPITIVGVRSEGKPYINPTNSKLSEIKDKIDAAVVLAREKPTVPTV